VANSVPLHNRCTNSLLLFLPSVHIVPLILRHARPDTNGTKRDLAVLQSLLIIPMALLPRLLLNNDGTIVIILWQYSERSSPITSSHGRSQSTF
jgi:hypothetical protein